MKFLLNDTLAGHRMMRLLLTGLQVFTLVFIALDMWYKSEQIGLSYGSVFSYLFGNEAAFRDAVDLRTLVEMLHADIFFAMMIVMTLGAVYVRVCYTLKYTAYLMHIMMMTAFIAGVSLLAALYLSPLFIWVWLATFWIWHLSVVVMSSEVLWRLNRS